MINLSDAKRWLKGLKPMQTALNLNDWVIWTEFKTIEDGKGQCSPRPGYQRAMLTFNLAEIDDEKDFLRCLRHELLHLLNGESQLYRQACMNHVCDSHAQNALEDVYDNVEEHLVRRLECLLDSFGYTPEKLIRKGEA